MIYGSSTSGMNTERRVHACGLAERQVSFTTFNAVRLEQQYLWCKEMPGFDPTMVNAGLFMRLTEYAQEKIIWWQPGWVDSCLILWNTYGPHPPSCLV